MPAKHGTAKIDEKAIFEAKAETCSSRNLKVEMKESSRGSALTASVAGGIDESRIAAAGTRC